MEDKDKIILDLTRENESLKRRVIELTQNMIKYRRKMGDIDVAKLVKDDDAKTKETSTTS